MGASVRPAAGPTYLVVGDAAGVANPFSGAGMEYAIETGMLAGGVLDEALRWIETFDQPASRKLAVELETETEAARGER